MDLQINPFVARAKMVAPALPMQANDGLAPSLAAVRSQERMAALLALLSGYVDAYTYLNYKTYASFMSGNTTQTGLQIGQINLAQAANTLLPIPCFVAGVFVGTLLVNSNLRSQLRWLFGVVTLLLALGMTATFFGRTINVPGWSIVILLSVAMGILNTTVTRVGQQSVSLGYVTGTLNNLAQHLALGLRRLPVPNAQGAWDTHGRRVALLVGIWIAFLFGALLAGTATPHFAVWTLLLPLLTLLALTLFYQTTSADA